MIKLVLSLSLLVSVFHLSAQTFNGGGGQILDNQTLNATVNVSGLPSAINTSTFGLERVCVNLTHSWDADLTITIIAPDGTSATLVTNTGGDGDNMQTTCFQWDALTSITLGSAPFDASYKPIEEMGIVNNDQNPNGQWTLRILDSFGGDEGNLINWSLTFSANPAQYFHLEESNLPIVVITTENGQGIPDEPKLNAQMGIIDNGPGMINHIGDPYNNYNNRIGIEQRGSSSANFPQKSYGFETRDVNGTQHDTVLLGMPEEHDWVLYAPYDDKTCMRNVLSYDIANKTGHYAPRTKLCELVLNGQYKGIYVLMEKIKRDNNRVDIAKLEPTEITGDDLTGGYIVKVDRNDGPGTFWTSDFQTAANNDVKIVYVYPKPEDIMPEQRAYIQAYVDSFETALDGNNFDDPEVGYRKFIDVNAFVDYMLLDELSKNVDAYRLSTFLYKDKNSNGGKLVAGPAWDYNLGWWNADYCEGDNASGWVYVPGAPCADDVPFWWNRLMDDAYFRSEMKCRWTELRQHVLSIPAMNAFIDSVALTLDEAKDRHFYTWPILGQYTWPNPSPIPADYPEEILALKNWIVNRVAWMDANLPGICYLDIDNTVLQEQQVSVFPNPFNGGFEVSFYLPEARQLTIRLTNTLGQTVKTITQTQFQQGENTLSIDVSEEDLVNGLYLLEIGTGNNTVVKKLLKR
jgi:subtilisin-like proprotein convertase family protein